MQDQKTQLTWPLIGTAAILLVVFQSNSALSFSDKEDRQTLNICASVTDEDLLSTKLMGYYLPEGSHQELTFARTPLGLCTELTLTFKDTQPQKVMIANFGKDTVQELQVHATGVNGEKLAIHVPPRNDGRFVFDVVAASADRPLIPLGNAKRVPYQH